LRFSGAAIWADEQELCVSAFSVHAQAGVGDADVRAVAGDGAGVAALSRRGKIDWISAGGKCFLVCDRHWIADGADVPLYRGGGDQGGDLDGCDPGDDHVWH